MHVLQGLKDYKAWKAIYTGAEGGNFPLYV